jgi:ABC-2 type transport system permease protein
MTGVTGTGLLVRLGLRRDRRQLLVWVLALGLLSIYTVVALDRLYPTAADRAARAAVVDTPAGIIFSGPGFGTDAYTLGAMTANEMGLTIMIAMAIMSILLVVRHTRAEEEDGRAELLLAGSIGRQAPLTTAVALMMLADVAVATLIGLGLIGTGLEVVDSLVFVAGLALTGMVFGGVAAVTAQLFEHGRAASGAALAVLGVTAVARGIGDMLEDGGSWLSWLSPIAWAQQTRPFVELRWWPLLLSVALIAGLVELGFALNGRRDFAAGAVAPRRGPARAPAWLTAPGMLFARLQRGTVIGWAVALLVLGGTFGSLAREAASMIADNPAIAAAFGGAEGSFVDAFLSVSALYLAFGSAAFAVASVLRLRAEETSGRAELLLAHPLDRRRFLGSGLLVTGLATLLLLLVGGLGGGLAAAASLGDGAYVWSGVTAALAHAPAVLVIAGLAAMLVGLVPQWSMLAWLVLAWSLITGMFGPLLELPEWALKLGPFGWDPAVPAEEPAAAPLIGLVLTAAVLVSIALAGFRGRDVPAS